VEQDDALLGAEALGGGAQHVHQRISGMSRPKMASRPPSSSSLKNCSESASSCCRCTLRCRSDDHV